MSYDRAVNKRHPTGSELVLMRGHQHNVSRTIMFRNQLVRTNTKYYCVPVEGVASWNSCM